MTNSFDNYLRRVKTRWRVVLGFAAAAVMYFLLSGPEYWLMRKGIVPYKIVVALNYPLDWLQRQTGVYLLDSYLLKWNPDIYGSSAGARRLARSLTEQEKSGLLAEAQLLRAEGLRSGKRLWHAYDSKLPPTMGSLSPEGVSLKLGSDAEILNVSLSSGYLMAHGYMIVCQSSVTNYVPGIRGNYIVAMLAPGLFEYRETNSEPAELGRVKVP